MNTPTHEKTCPHCAEVIKATAVVCRYCQRDLSPPPITAMSDSTQWKLAGLSIVLMACGGVAAIKGFSSWLAIPSRAEVAEAEYQARDRERIIASGIYRGPAPRRKAAHYSNLPRNLWRPSQVADHKAKLKQQAKDIRARQQIKMAIIELQMQRARRSR